MEWAQVHKTAPPHYLELLIGDEPAPLRVVIFKKMKLDGWSEDWRLLCSPLGLTRYSLDTTDVEEAKLRALALVRKGLRSRME